MFSSNSPNRLTDVLVITNMLCGASPAPMLLLQGAHGEGIRGASVKTNVGGGKLDRWGGGQVQRLVAQAVVKLLAVKLALMNLHLL